MKFNLTRLIKTPTGDWFGKSVLWEINKIEIDELMGSCFIRNNKKFILYESPIKNGYRRHNLECIRRSGKGYSSRYIFRNIKSKEELQQALKHAEEGNK